VTGLGEFSPPCGRLFTLGNISENHVCNKKLELLFNRKKVRQYFGPKMSWGAFWAIFHGIIWSPCFGAQTKRSRHHHTTAAMTHREDKPVFFLFDLS
jgi:hypothetical protein